MEKGVDQSYQQMPPAPGGPLPGAPGVAPGYPQQPPQGPPGAPQGYDPTSPTGAPVYPYPPAPGQPQPGPPGPYPPGPYPPGPPGAYPPQQYAPPGPPGAYPHPQGAPQMMMMVPVPAGPQPLPNYWPPHPITVTCPGCNNQVQTQAFKNPGLGTWLIAGGLCLVGCGFGCCLIPFCVDSCKDTTHQCPKCNRFLGQQKMV